MFALAVLAMLAASMRPAHAGDLVVSAAASLTNAFGEIAKTYEAQHAGTHVVLNFAASDVLLKQIEQGAPADVFASADEVTMDRAASGGHIDLATRRDFAANALVLVAPIGSAAPLTLGDLKQERYKHIAIGNPDSVPAGRYAKRALVDAGLWDALQLKLVDAQNVRQALDYVARGEAEAGFVYATDAATQAQKVRIVLNVPTATPVRYPVAVVAGSAQERAARSFVELLFSAHSQAVLAHDGFSRLTP
ncbi:MAG: molybdate ABC transporter substrate-binding protein [Rudaea sp.]